MWVGNEKVIGCFLPPQSALVTPNIPGLTGIKKGAMYLKTTVRDHNIEIPAGLARTLVQGNERLHQNWLFVKNAQVSIQLFMQTE